MAGSWWIGCVPITSIQNPYTVSGRGSYVTGVVTRDVVRVPAGATITARNASEHDRRAGHDAPVLIVTTATGRSEYRADEVEIHTTK